MTQEEKEDYETLEGNEKYLFQFIETLFKELKRTPQKWKSFIDLTSPLMGKTLEMIIAEGEDPRWPAE